MFLLNIGYQWPNDIGEADGVIINACSMHMEQLVRRNLEEKLGEKPGVVLFDPQLYLAGLDEDTCNLTCAKLSTYQWFGGSEIEFDSGEISQREWFNQHRESMTWPGTVPIIKKEVLECIRNCFNYQLEIGVTQLIIPVPLVEDPDDEFVQQIFWIDAALELKDDYELPMLATVAFVDQLLIHQPPLENKLAQAIIDNIAVRTELDGIYVLPVQTVDNTTRIDNKRVAEFLLHISYIVGHENEKIVVVNFADAFGYACLGVGGTAYGGGYTTKTKRMNMSDYIEKDGGGGAYPKFYSHNLILDLLSDRDLSKIRDEKLLRFINGDKTEASKDLLETLKQGNSANDLPPWRESKNNVAYATAHRIDRLVKAARNLNRIDDLEDRENNVLEWLQNAEAYYLLLQKRFSEDPLSDDGRHITVWRAGFEAYLENK